MNLKELLGEDMYGDLARIAKLRKTSMNNLMREAIFNFLLKEKERIGLSSKIDATPASAPAPASTPEPASKKKRETKPKSESKKPPEVSPTIHEEPEPEPESKKPNLLQQKRKNLGL